MTTKIDVNGILNNIEAHSADLEVGTVAELPARVPPGAEYIVGFIRVGQGMFHGRGRIFLWFEIVSPLEHTGKRLYLCCPEPRGKTFGFGSKFVSAWMVAMGRRPVRRDRLSTSVFRGKY